MVNCPDCQKPVSALTSAGVCSACDKPEHHASQVMDERIRVEVDRLMGLMENAYGGLIGDPSGIRVLREELELLVGASFDA